MNNMLLMIIFGSIEIIVPALLTILGIVGVFGVFAFIMVKKEEKYVLKNGMVVYPETLFEDIEEMKKVGILRLYSKRIKKNLFVITTTEITEEYKDGKFVSYASAKPVILNAKTTSLKDFLNNVPEVNYKSMIKGIGAQTRIEYEMVSNFKGVNSQKENKQIAKIRFLFDYCSSNIFFYNADGSLLSWNYSLIPPEWQEDVVFMNLNKQICEIYESLFINNKTEFSFVGFKEEQQKAEFKKLVDKFVNYVCKKANGQYEIINNYDVDSL